MRTPTLEGKGCPFIHRITSAHCFIDIGPSSTAQASRGCSDILWDAQREFPVAVTADGAQDARCMTGGNDDVFSYEVNQDDPYGWVVW